MDQTGSYLGTDTIYPFKGVGDVERAKADFLRFLARHNPLAIAVGNGTAIISALNEGAIGLTVVHVLSSPLQSLSVSPAAP